MRTLTCEPDVEVIGASMISLIDNLVADEIRPTLEKHGLTEIDRETWYPAQKWLAVMNELAVASNTMSSFVAVGMGIARNAVLPPQLQDAPLGKIIEMWDVIYQKQHRGSNIGSKVIEKVSDNHYRITLKDLYPDDLSYGVAYGWCRRFLPPETPFTVQYEDMSKRRDEETSDSTVLIVQWS